MRVVAAMTVVLGALACMGGSDAPELKLLRLEAGDAACYVVLQASDGSEIVYDGDFDLCPGAPADATFLIGQAVALDLTKQQVMAGSCEGDPECTEHEEVDFVTALRPAP